MSAGTLTMTYSAIGVEPGDDSRALEIAAYMAVQ
jgi:hypothetical protein